MSDFDKAVDTAKEASSTLSSIVPQLFFDVIARLIPGIAIIWSFYLALFGNRLLDVAALKAEISALLPENSFLLFTITAIIFYITSIAFYGLWSGIINFIISRPSNKHKYENAFIEVMGMPIDASYRYEFIKLNAPIAGNRVTKLKAEIHMSGALTTAFALCFIIATTFSLVDSTLNHFQLIARCLFFLTGTLGFLACNRHSSRHLVRSIDTISTLLDYDKKLHSLAMTTKLTATFTRNDAGEYEAYVEEIPGTNTTGRTIEQARINLIKRVQQVLQDNRESAENKSHPRGEKPIREYLALTTTK